MLPGNRPPFDWQANVICYVSAFRGECDVGICIGLDSRVNAQAEGSRHLQSVDDKKIVRPGLREIFPRMGRRIRADESVLPIVSRTIGVLLA